MPKALHDKLERRANEKGLTGERKDAYVFGTMARIEKRQKSRAPRRQGRRGG